MKFSIRYSSIDKMLVLLDKLNSGDVKREEVADMLKNEDYIFEFDRYKGRITQDEYIEYFLNLPRLTVDDICNNDLKIHHSYYKDILNNIEFYTRKYDEFKKSLTDELFKNQISIAVKGLPEDIILPDMNFIFTIGIGQSFGYAHKNGMHFDFLQLAKDKHIDEFFATISHEVHHVGVNMIHDEIDIDKISVEALFYVYFSGEGLAVKYCNNAEGRLSKSIYSGPRNIGLDGFTWEYLNRDFYRTMDHFKHDIDDIRSGRIKNINELNDHMAEYWMSPYTDEQKKGDIPKLKHFRLYSFGNDIWGIIHDCFGKEAVYQTLRNPESFPGIYNRALDKLGHKEFMI